MCDNPIYIPFTDYCGIKRYIPCPCCKCPSCLKDHRNGWSIRLFEESKVWKYVRFITLTYKPESLPVSLNKGTGELVSTARIKDVSNCFKWFRTYYKRTYGEDCKLKYFVCSEYGSKGSKRPHYHGLVFFNFDPSRFGSFLDHWSTLFGYTLVKPVGNSIKDKQSVTRYVTKYITKKRFCSRSSDIFEGLISAPSFVMSKGLGSSYVTRMYDYHRNCELHDMVDRMYYTFDGKIKYSLPKFYKERFYKKVKYKLNYDVTFSEDYGAVSFHNVRLVKRYTSECLLSVAIADLVRNRSVANFCRAVRFTERTLPKSDRSRFQAVAQVRINSIRSLQDKSITNATNLADEINTRYFTDFHS